MYSKAKISQAPKGSAEPKTCIRKPNASLNLLVCILLDSWDDFHDPVFFFNPMQPKYENTPSLFFPSQNDLACTV